MCVVHVRIQQDVCGTCEDTCEDTVRCVWYM